ncbi:MAG: DnaD domain protein, partial [Oscillospiraceae bacterium]|nr:DnaD domain protein [Oscillospiraceae bacterium]
MQINYGSHVFAVPGDVVDHFIRLADETQLRVLLCFLRSDGNSSAEQIASYLKITPDKAEEALQFWLQANILSDNGTAAPGFAFAASAAESQKMPAEAQKKPEDPQPAAAPAATPLIIHDTSQNVKLDPSEIAQKLNADSELSGLFTMTEKKIGTPLKHSYQRLLIWLYDELNLPAEVIYTLFCYCADISKSDPGYIETIAVQWVKDGITTLELAVEEVNRMLSYHSYENELRRMFYMKRPPVSSQKKCMERWQAAGYSMELLHYAYEVTVENTEKLSFP